MNTADNRQRVLVVDDEGTIRELVADALRESGFEVETAANGLSALERMSAWVPHAVVLDLMMPHLDGVSFSELMHLNPRFATVPIVLVTAAYGAHDSAERVGAKACLTKPFELDELVDTLHGLLNQPLTAHTLAPTVEAAGQPLVGDF